MILLLLLLLLLPGALPGAGSHAAGNPPLQVNGMLGGSICFPLKLPVTKTVVRIEWYFQTGSSPKFLIATFRDGKLERQNGTDQLGQRVEMADEVTLRIRALEKEEDGGVLTASLLFATGELHEQTFCLSVFEPLPEPHIHAQLASTTAEGCNMTLQCVVSRKGAFNISWKRGNQLSILEEHSGWYRLSAKGADLHMSWRPNSSDSDSTFTCLLTSPVDRKNVSVDLLSICPSDGEGQPRMMWFLLSALLFLPILAAGLVFYLWKKRSSQGAVLPIVPERKASPELNYTELRNLGSPSEGDENQDADPVSRSLAEIPMVMAPGTVYATLQLPPTT